MKAVILAAGAGKRLFPLTERKPKALLEVNGKPLLSYQLKYLQKYLDLQDVHIIVGHCGELIKEFTHSCRIINNLRYRDTNNIYSLWLIKDFIDEEFLLINSDVVFHEKILNELIESSYENAISIESGQQLSAEEMKVLLKENILTAIGKDIDPTKATGEYIGLAKFSRQGSKILFSKISEMVAKGGVNKWYEAAFAEIAGTVDIYGISTNSLPWAEIDTLSDWLKAQSIKIE